MLLELLVPPMFDWNAVNTDHVAKHGIETVEVEEAMTDPNRVGFDVHDRDKKRIGFVLGVS